MRWKKQIFMAPPGAVDDSTPAWMRWTPLRRPATLGRHAAGGARMTRVPSGREANSRGRGTPAGLWAILNAIARTAARLCEANDALILRLQGDQLRFVAKHGRIPMLEALGESLPFSRRAIAGRAVLERRTIHIHDLAVAVRKEFPETRAAQRASGSRTVLVTPLLRNGSAIGAIVIRRTTVRPFTAKQIALLKTFADQAAIAIENARLSEALHARNRELTEALEQQTATSEILRVISSSPTDVQPVFDAIIGNAVRLCGAVYGIVWRYEGDLTEFVSAHNLQPEELEELRRLFPRRTDVDTDHIHTMMRSGAVLAVPDIEAYEHVTPQQRARWRARGVRSLLVVPMRRDREVIGAIGVSHRDVGAFPAGRVELLKTFADQAVIAVENVRLFKELQTKNRERRDPARHLQLTDRRPADLRRDCGERRTTVRFSIRHPPSRGRRPHPSRSPSQPDARGAGGDSAGLPDAAELSDADRARHRDR